MRPVRTLINSSIADYALFVKRLHCCADKSVYKQCRMQTIPSKLEEYASGYRDLFKDKRLFMGFVGTLQGIIGSQSLRISKIANSSSVLGTSRHAERRIRRLVHGENQRANWQIEKLRTRFIEEGAKRLAWEKEVLLLLDESDLRKPFANAIEHLDKVRSLTGEVIPGFHTLNVLAIGESGRRTIVYHHSFSTLEPGFKSVKAEYKKAIDAVTNALRKVGVGRLLWVIDRAGDDLKLMRHIHESGSCFVTRLQHSKRLCRWQGKETQVSEVLAQAPMLANASLEKRLLKPEVKRDRHKKITIKLSGVEVELSEATGLVVTLAEIHSPLGGQGWILLSNLRMNDDASGLLKRLISIYRQRWSIEDLFAWSKQALGWETVQLMDFEALRTLVAFAWIAAAFLHDLGVDQHDETLQFLAKLGGVNPQKTKPGPRTLSLALDHLASFLVVAQHAPQVGGQDALISLIHRLFPQT